MEQLLQRRAPWRLRARYRAAAALCGLCGLLLWSGGQPGPGRGLAPGPGASARRELAPGNGSDSPAAAADDGGGDDDGEAACPVFNLSVAWSGAEDVALVNAYNQLTGSAETESADTAQCMWISSHQGDDGCDAGDGHFVQLFSLGKRNVREEACTAGLHGVAKDCTEAQAGFGDDEDVNNATCVARDGCLYSGPGLGGDSYINMYYCRLGHGVLGTLYLIFILVLMFLMLGSTSEDFFCPALASLSGLLRLEPRVAGVTLLALGNGAPDVFSIIASVKAKSAAMAVGEVTGAGNFVTTAVVGAVALTTDDGLKARGMFLRDVCMLVVATALLLWVFVDGEVEKWEAIAFLVLYVGYVAIVMIGDRVPPMLKKERPHWREERARKAAERRGEAYEPAAAAAAAAGGGAEGDQPLLDQMSLEAAGAPEGGSRNREDDEDFFLPKLGSINMANTRFSYLSVTPKGALLSSENGAGARAAAPDTSPLRDQWSTKSMSGRDIMSPDMTGAGFSPRTRPARSSSIRHKKGWTKYRMKNKLDLAIEWSEMEALDKVCYVLEGPFTFARCLTIPVVVEERTSDDWDAGFARMFMIVNPPFSLPFLVNGFASVFSDPLEWNDPWMLGSACIGLICCPLVWLNTARSPAPIVVNVYVVVAFFNALFWIGFVADDLVALLNTLGGIFSLDHAAMGLTVLAMGNSLGDMAADLAVARSGKPNMAVTACYAGPFFNMCIGIGVSFLVATGDGKVSKADCTDSPNCNRSDMQLSTVLFFSSTWLIMAISATMVAAAAFSFQLPRKFGYALMVLYAIFCALAVVVLKFSPDHFDDTCYWLFAC